MRQHLAGQAWQIAKERKELCPDVDSSTSGQWQDGRQRRSALRVVESGIGDVNGVSSDISLPNLMESRYTTEDNGMVENVCRRLQGTRAHQDKKNRTGMKMTQNHAICGWSQRKSSTAHRTTKCGTWLSEHGHTKRTFRLGTAHNTSLSGRGRNQKQKPNTGRYKERGVVAVGDEAWRAEAVKAVTGTPEPPASGRRSDHVLIDIRFTKGVPEDVDDEQAAVRHRDPRKIRRKEACTAQGA